MLEGFKIKYKIRLKVTPRDYVSVQESIFSLSKKYNTKIKIDTCIEDFFILTVEGAKIAYAVASAMGNYILPTDKNLTAYFEYKGVTLKNIFERVPWQEDEYISGNSKLYQYMGKVCSDYQIMYGFPHSSYNYVFKRVSGYEFVIELRLGHTDYNMDESIYRFFKPLLSTAFFFYHCEGKSICPE